jgi:hypothetical protein
MASQQVGGEFGKEDFNPSEGAAKLVDDCF